MQQLVIETIKGKCSTLGTSFFQDKGKNQRKIIWLWSHKMKVITKRKQFKLQYQMFPGNLLKFSNLLSLINQKTTYLKEDLKMNNPLSVEMMKGLLRSKSKMNKNKSRKHWTSKLQQKCRKSNWWSHRKAVKTKLN